MPDEKRYTARDLILAKREGFAAHCMRTCSRTQEHAQQLAEREYPLPKITRPRVVQDPHHEHASWCVRDGALRWSSCGPRGMIDLWNSDKVETCYSQATPERVALWADLLANPTEEVPDDA